MRQRRVILNIKDREILQKYSELHGFGSFFMEELLKLAFSRVSPFELRKAFFERGKEGVKELVREKITASAHTEATFQSHVVSKVHESKPQTETKKTKAIEDFWG